MLAEQLHDVYDKSDDTDNKDLKGKVKGKDKKDDREIEVCETRLHEF